MVNVRVAGVGASGGSFFRRKKKLALHDNTCTFGGEPYVLAEDLKDFAPHPGAIAR
mgnify:CR=1 FL=1